MFEKNFDSVIGIDTEKGKIHFYSADKGDKNSISYFVGSYKAKPFSKAFYEKISSIIEKFRESQPSGSLQKASIVLSDCAVLTDTVNLPIIHKRAMDTSLNASLANLYGSTDIKFNRLLAMQSKQFATYAVTGIRKDILVRLQDVLSSNQISGTNVTYCAAAATNAALMLNAKLKNASFVLLDIKEDLARIVLVVKGRTMGFYSLPFGTNVLKTTAVEAENMLFDHSGAELIVLNAKEKAKAKALTMADDFMTLPLTDEEEDEDTASESAKSAIEDEDDEDEEIDEPIVYSGRLRKKTPRKFPKYMQRPDPTSKAECVYENFRVFVKWTLEFIASNTSITSLGAPEAVYVNMPEEYGFLFDMVNAEAKENGIRFEPLTHEPSALVRGNLELYGGFFAKQLNKFNSFHSTQLDSFKTKAAQRSSGSLWDTIKKIATTPIGGKK